MAKRARKNRTALVPVGVRAKVPYVDSIAFVVPKFLDPEELAEMKRSLVHPSGYAGSVYERRVNRARGGAWFFLLLWLHQPTRRAIELAERRPGSIFYAVHVSLDLTVASPREALELQGYVLRHIHKEPRVAKLPTWRFKDKTHVGHERMDEYVDPETGEVTQRPSRRGSSIVVYADLPSKVTSEACVHVEYRIGGKRPLENDGFRSPADVLRLDHRDFWARRLHLLEPPSGDRIESVVAEAIGRRRTKEGAEPGTREERLRAAQEALRSAFADREATYPSAHGVDVAYVLQKTGLAGTDSPMRLFTPVAREWMLPTSVRNAFWAPDRRKLLE